ncbi:MAG: 5-dehydro-2-deoxygluconokinase [Firmicutes bacterium ADurb.Bin506]|nr:MAG: 5-dehydro-2-deoxygluconokinase [Firmicutes bacterium ADurb.Bin506]
MDVTGGSGKSHGVVCLGACAVDMMLTVPRFPAPDEMVFTLDEPRSLPGGSTGNIAAGLARLGVPTRFVGKVGADANGMLLKEAFEADGVDVGYLIQVPAGRTASTIIAVNPTGSRVIYSLGGTAVLERPEEFVPELLEGASLLYVGEAFPEVAERAMALAKQQGVSVVFGPGGGIEWLGREVLGRLMSAADFVLLSRRELHAAAGAREGLTDNEAAAELAACGVQRLVVTRGEQGSVFIDASGSTAPVVVGPFAVDAVDTTGAGDSFAAGFMSSLVQARPIGECLTRGNACAAMAIRKMGAREALPTLTELERFLQQNTAATAPAWAGEGS